MGQENQSPVPFLCFKGLKERIDMQQCICIWCGKTYHPTSNVSGHKYCSFECSLEDRRTKAEKAFLERFNEIYADRFVYSHGYSGSDGYAFCKCLKCGDVKKVSAQVVRSGHQIIGCAACAEIERLSKEQAQHEVRAAREQARHEARKIKAEDKQRERVYKLTHMVCNECGNIFTAKKLRDAYCSTECRNKHNNRYHEIKRRHRIRENGKIEYSISLTRLAKRDNHICYLCGCKVDMNADKNADAYGSIDHVIPVSKGGTHTWNNVRLAHRGCNTKKGRGMTFCTRSGQVKLCL